MTKTNMISKKILQINILNYLNWNKKYFIKYQYLNLSLFISNLYHSCLQVLEGEKNKKITEKCINFIY